jgi:hypothetical protein
VLYLQALAADVAELRSFMNDTARAAADQDGLLDTFAAELTRAAYHVALRHGATGMWLDLEIDLWQALANIVKQWERKSSPRQVLNPQQGEVP